jgi:hypothetical protein
MKIDYIKEEVTMIWKTSEKRMKQIYKTQWKATLGSGATEFQS